MAKENQFAGAFRPKRDADGNGQTNDVRADRAERAVWAFARDGGYRAEEAATGREPMQDLLCDLMHLADRRGEDFIDMLSSATNSYMEER